MKRLIFSPLATRDINGVWDYTAGRWGLDQAEYYVGAIRVACNGLLEYPDTGRMPERYAPDTANREADRILFSTAGHPAARSKSSVYCIRKWILVHICSTGQGEELD